LMDGASMRVEIVSSRAPHFVGPKGISLSQPSNNIYLFR
jgi:hypothetical protein